MSSLAPSHPRCDARPVDDRHPSHQFLKAPPWAGDARPATRASGLDLSDLSGRIPAADVVRRAARNVSPLAVTRPSAWMLRRALAQAHEMGVGQIFPRLSLSHLLAPIVTTFLGPGDQAFGCVVSVCTGHADLKVYGDRFGHVGNGKFR